MRYLRFLGILALLGICLGSASFANAQRVVVGVGVGPDYWGPAPICDYGYYDYYPYTCAPYGYYGPNWFAGGIFIGAGPWFHGFRGGRGFFGPGFRGRGFDGRGFGRRGFDGRGRGFDGRGQGFVGRGGVARGSVGGNFRGGSPRGGMSGGFRGGSSRGGMSGGFRGGSSRGGMSGGSRGGMGGGSRGGSSHGGRR